MAALKVKLNNTQTAVLAAFITAAQNIGLFSSKLTTALSDGKLTGAEIIDIVITAPALMSAIKPLLSNLKNWTYFEVEEKQAVVEAFASTFDLDNDTAENAIEVMISAAVSIEDSLTKLVKAAKSLKKVPATVTAAAVKMAELPAEKAA